MVAVVIELSDSFFLDGMIGNLFMGLCNLAVYDLEFDEGLPVPGRDGLELLPELEYYILGETRGLGATVFFALRRAEGGVAGDFIALAVAEDGIHDEDGGRGRRSGREEASIRIGGARGGDAYRCRGGRPRIVADLVLVVVGAL